MTQNDDIADGVQSLKLRSYQEEVLEKSLKSNVIVAMPTGSKHKLLEANKKNNIR